MSIKNIRIFVLALFFSMGIAQRTSAFHLIGGEISWECQGSGQYIFSLSVYRDCNGPPFSTAGVALRVWHHPALSSIPMTLVSQTDISPVCTPVAGGPSAISCGSGGSGSIEHFLFQSAPITISGVPPAQGWAFTYDNFSRNLAIDNLQTPNVYGLTLRAIMYPHTGTNTNPCFDSSPIFMEEPSNVICNGTDFKLNHHAYDPDGDSLVFSFGQALDQISTSSPAFNPPASPIAIPYVAGYAFNSPTPGTALDPGNVPATINSRTGEISFRSNTLGNFVVVVKVSSYRCGQLISEVYRETQIVIVNCSGNNLPVFTPPFGSSFSTSVYAGQPVNFNLTVTDNDLLQDGSPQTITLRASGNQFGAGFTNPAAGCDQVPCATLNTTLPASSTASIVRSFNWVTNCDHLSNTSCGQTGKNYQFVFRAADNFCPAPGVSTATVSVTVLPLPEIPAPHINCADVALNGDVTLTWTPPVDPSGASFIKYEVFNANTGVLLATINTLATNTFTHIGADAQNGSISYVIKVHSGCNGVYTTTSDTVSSMYLNVINLSGVARLQWNKLFSPVNSSTASPVYNIWREFPLGTWTMIGTRPYGNEVFTDTISICDDTINYQVSVVDATAGCTSFSSVDGDRFTDLTEPHTPIISYVTVDTATNQTQIVWYPSTSPDTEGYIILQQIGSTWIVIDTVMGILNTTYVPVTSNPDITSETYGVAAFDTCWHGSPPAPNTSSLSGPHNTMFTTTILQVCDSSVLVNWNAYTGWPNGVSTYEIYARKGTAPYILAGTVSGSVTQFLHQHLDRDNLYKYLVKAISFAPGVSSLSNITSRYIKQPKQPSFAYLQTVTVVSDNEILVRFMPDISASIKHYRVMRSDDNGYTFNEVGLMSPGGTPLELVDATVQTQMQSYIYKIISVDSCGKEVLTSNEGKTIFLQAIADPLHLQNNLNWNPYRDWDGFVNEYRILRSINHTGYFEGVGSAPPVSLNYNDDVSELLYTTGEFCYKISGVENINTYGFAETSESNTVCVAQDPLVYVPNAFTPGGKNPVFMPVISYIDYYNYSFEIYNRWGERIFGSSDVHIGWDGTENSKECKEDVYVYLVKFKTGDGKDVEVKGHVTLVDYR